MLHFILLTRDTSFMCLVPAFVFFFFQAEDGIRDSSVTGVQTCALPIFAHQSLSDSDYQYARCGREVWEKPSPLAGYFTTCGNIHDGILAYRAAGLPITLKDRKSVV